MDRRKFIKSSLCMGTIAAAGACLGYKHFSNDFHPENKFLYKDESELPTTIRLEACNMCQLNCVKCWMRLDEDKVFGGFGYLKFENFKNFVDRHPFIKKIELSNNGEIFLNPELDEILKYGYEKNIQLYATNGVNLNTISEKTAENLVKYKLMQMNVSIDAATPEVYKIYRRGGDFNKVISNIEMINKFKEKYNSFYPMLLYNFILFGHNEHEIDAAKALAKKLNMKMKFEQNCEPDYSPIKDHKTVSEKTGIELINKNGKWVIKPSYADEFGFCYELVRYPQINFNGDLLGCCVLYLNSFRVNVFEEGLLNAMNNQRVLLAKLMLSDLKTKAYKDVPCSNCLYYHARKKYNEPVDFGTVKNAVT